MEHYTCIIAHLHTYPKDPNDAKLYISMIAFPTTIQSIVENYMTILGYGCEDYTLSFGTLSLNE